ncbi:MAG: methyl-accepting chemotaxis protein [Paracoccaceae bacterium]|nr:methyl-accepting chemotaxis protein [Paracoccaceae bacterium]
MNFLTETPARTAALVRAVNRSNAVIAFEPDGTIIEANEAFLGAMGYSLAEVAGKHHRIFMDAAEAAGAEYRAFWQRLGAGEYARGEFRRLHKSGREIWIAATYNPVLDEAGRVTAVVKLATDITERNIAVREVMAALVAMSNGDIGTRLGAEVTGEFASLRETFNATMDDFEDVLRSIMATAKEINWVVDATSENSDRLTRMARDGVDQLASTTSTLSEISQRITDTGTAAGEADTEARSAEAKARRGGEIVAEMVTAIGGIEKITREVSKITKVIETFAFQTNLLSINAAVEAARAGDAGKGFAVVASEVRNLAQRSAEASQNIADLTQRAETEVAAGSERARAAGDALGEIENAVSVVVEAIARVAGSAEEQAGGVRNVGGALGAQQDRLGELTHMADDVAGQSKNLSEQARRMDTIVKRFSTRVAGAEGLPPAGRERRQSAPPVPAARGRQAG